MSTRSPALSVAASNSSSLPAYDFDISPQYSGTFIPMIWSSKLNVKFYAQTTFGDISNTNWEGEVKSLGDKVVISNTPTININAYSIGQSLLYQVPVPSVVELNIDKAFYFGVNVPDVLAYQSKPNLMDMFSGDAANQLKIVVDAECFHGALFDQPTTDTPALCHASNTGATAGLTSAGFDLGTGAAPVTLTGANILAKITAMSAVLDEQNVPETDRWLVITPFERNLLMQSNLAQAQFMGDGTSIVRNGRIGIIDRFSVYVSNLLPKSAAGKDYLYGTAGNTSGTLKRHAVVAGHKSAFTFAAQISKVENIPNPTDFGTLVRGLMVYGRKEVSSVGFAILQVAG